VRKGLNTAHSFPGLARLSWINRHGSFWRRLGRHLEATRPDVAIAFMPPAIKALAYARVDPDLLKIASTHNAPFQDYENPLRWDPSRIDRKRRLECLAEIDRVCVLLPEYASYYTLDPDKIVVLANAVKPVPVIVPPQDRQKVIAVSGRLERVKRHDLSILAWKKIQDRFPQWSLQIFGEGSQRRDLEALIAKNNVKRVRLMGHQPNAVDRVARSAVLLHPASYEGFPLSVCEALAAGTPVVGFEDCTGLNYLVQDNVNGLLCKAENRVDSLALRLGQILQDDGLRYRLSEAGPGSVAAFSPDAVIDQWEDMIHRGK
jgi:glycosyltransferase involved in cell wall biosynthesis